MSSLSRRQFLTMSAYSVGGAAVSSLLPSAALAQNVPINDVSIQLNYMQSPKKLVFVNLGGAPDGMELLVPYGDPELEKIRGTIYRGKPGSGTDIAPLALNGDFGASARLPILQSLYNKGQYIGIHAAALQHTNRSHFDAQNMLGNGTLNPGANTSGWMNRLTRVISEKASLNKIESTMLTIAPYGSSPLVTRGQTRPMLIDRMIKNPLPDSYYNSLLESVLTNKKEDEYYQTGKILEEGLQLRKAFDGYISNISGGDAIKNRVIKMNNDLDKAAVVGGLMSRPDSPRIAALNIGGWDSHAGQHLIVDYGYGRLLKKLNDIILELQTSMKSEWNNCAVIIGGEFGRTCRVNGTGGTDHGIGTSWHLVGGAVNGGRIIADWPGLREADMIDGRYLRPTTNITSVFKGIMKDSFGLSNNELNEIFPDSTDVAPMQGLLT